MKHISLFIDLAFCLIILPLMIFIFPVERWWGAIPVYFGVFVAWIYVTFFLYRHYVVPRIFSGGRNTLYACTAIAVSLIVTFAIASYDISTPFYQIRQQLDISYPIWGVRQSRQAIWLHYIIVVALCFAVGMIMEAYKQRMAREEVEYERNKAELALFKAQINPHFLFNTLNTIYGLLITNSDKTASSMERFIEITRYIYDKANRDFTSLNDEIRYISQYIELQRLRLTELAQVSFDTDVENGVISVPSMLLMTFVENAFKHGISSSEHCFVRIFLSQSDDIVTFEVENSVKNDGLALSSGVGLVNCRRRLELLCPGRFTLRCGCDEDVYRVSLTLKSKEE